MSWRVDRYGFPDLGELHTYYCCNFTAHDNFGKAGVLGGLFAAAGFAVAAGFIRSHALSVAWLLGPTLFKAAELPEIGIRAIFPSQSLLGWSMAQQNSNYVVSTTLLSGFWFALGGTLVVIACRSLPALARWSTVSGTVSADCGKRVAGTGRAGTRAASRHPFRAPS